MHTSRFVVALRKAMIGSAIGGLLAGSSLVQAAEISDLFESLREQGRNAEQVISGLQENGVELKDATVYSVANGGGIGLAIAYAQAGVCLAPDEATAQVVGQAAVDNAPENAGKAVQAGVVSALASYSAGQCRQLLDQLNSASQAFAAPTGSSAGAAPAGGGAPDTEAEEPPVSESE